MEEEGMQDEDRWSSYSSHDHDLRMQNRTRNYDPYEIDSRQPPRSGHYADIGASSRGPANMKSLIANEQGPSRRRSKPSAVAHHVIRKEGPNWILIVGGAIVTAIGVLIVRRQKPAVPKATGNTLPASGKDRVQQSGLSFATTRRESTGSRTSELSTDSPYSGDPYMLAHNQPWSLSEGSRVGSDWGDDECNPTSPPATPPSSYYSQFPKASSHSNRTVITPTSPPGSYRGADTSATECNDPMVLSPPARLGFSSRRDMVHRLRQQLKSRDEMILEMQAQISDQEHTISLHQAHCRDLERRLEDSGRTLRQSDLEIQRLSKAVADFLAGGPVPNCGNLPSSSAYDERGIAKQIQKLDDTFLIREAGRLADELKVSADEKEELERIASLRMKEHELVVQKLQVLEAELEEARKSDFGKDLLLEAYEVEQENLEDKVDNLKRLIETKPPEKSPASSMIGRKSFSGGLGILKPDHERRGYREGNGSFVAESFRVQASAKQWLKTDESSSNGDVSDESEADVLSPVFGDKLITKLQQEVEQLSSVLAAHSDMIYKKRLATSYLVDEFQRHSALVSDVQQRVDEEVDGTPESRDQDSENNCQNLSSSNDRTSAVQVQELSDKLEQIAKQQRVEEEIANLSKHQVKIAELKQRVEKLLNKCQNLQDSNGSLDAETHQRASKMAAAGLQLAKQLQLQEEQASRTSREVQRLSASFQLSSPYVPRSKKEELQKMLQASSSGSLSPPLERDPPNTTNMSRIVSNLQSRFTTGSEGRPKESGDILFDQEHSVSSAEPVAGAAASLQSENRRRLQVEEQFVYRPGFSVPSTRKSRRGFPINSFSGKEQSAGVKKRRGGNKGASREPENDVVSDSNRWVDRGSGVCVGSSPDAWKKHRFHALPKTFRHRKELPMKHRYSADEDFSGVGEQTDKDLLLNSSSESQCTERFNGSVGSRRQSGSGDSLSDSSTMRIGSPRIAGHSVSVENSIESTKSSFGGFLFDIEAGDRVYAMNQDECGPDIEVNDTMTTPQLSPCTKIMARLDLKDLPSTSGSQDSGSSCGNMSGLSTNMLIAGSGSPEEGGSNNKPGSISGSSISIDSSFDALLSNTLDDLVRVCSTPSTPAQTPDSLSFMSSQSDAVQQV